MSGRGMGGGTVGMARRRSTRSTEGGKGAAAGLDASPIFLVRGNESPAWIQFHRSLEGFQIRNKLAAGAPPTRVAIGTAFFIGLWG